MLNFQKLVQQISNVEAETLAGNMSPEEAVENASISFDQACEQVEVYDQKLAENAHLVLWPLATPLQDLSHRQEIDPSLAPHTVVAVDGSQIMPSHHEVYNCYLLNIGTTVISYGIELPVLLNSTPNLYHRPEDLYPLVDRRRIHIDELYVSLERNILELQSAVDLALAAKERQLPAIALIDGSLIPWSIERMPDRYQQTYSARLLNLLRTAERHEIPLVGYISNSRSSDLVNSLRTFICPYPQADCRKHCAHLNEEDFPCSSIWPLTDRQLLFGKLAKGTFSATFVSGANVNKILPDEQKTSFLYLNIGNEIARLEFPRWLFNNPNLLQFTVSAIYSQAQKGMGYPISLTEAHNLAVIRGNDRSEFFKLLTQHLIGLGLGQIKVSPKERSKRKSII